MLMTRDEFKALGLGDIVESAANGEIAIVTANYGGRVTAVRTYDLTNSQEWSLIRKVVVGVLKTREPDADDR